MTDLRSRLSSLDALPAPDLWHEAELRAATPAPDKHLSRSSLVPIGLAMILAVVAGSAMLVGSGVLPLPRLIDNVPPSEGPRSSEPPGPTLEIVRTTLVTNGADMQVVVEVRNVSETWVSLDGPTHGVPQRGTLVDGEGRPLTTEGAVELWAFPERIGPVETGYFVADPNLGGIAPEAVAGLAFSPRATAADGPPALRGSGEVRGFGGEGTSPITLDITADWNGGGSATVAVIAFDEAGEAVGFARRPLEEPGQATLCCIPHPGGQYAEGIADTLVIVVPEGGSVAPSPSTAASSASPSPSETAESIGPGTWTAVASSVTGYMTGHSLTLLADGRVLLLVDSAQGNQARVFNPATGSWVISGGLRDGRSWHSATLLSDGRVLVAGGGSVGIDTVALASAEIFDPSNGTWAQTGPMLQARYGHTATLLRGGRVLVTGGLAQDRIGGPATAVSTSEIYDPTTETWAAAADMLESRTHHTATLLTDGTVLVAGGGEPGGQGAETYDPVAGTWTATAPMVDPGHEAASLLANGSVIIVGGSLAKPTAEIYDPETRTWTATGSMSKGRMDLTATRLPDGRVLAAGGGNGGYRGFREAELYNPASGTWTPAPDMGSQRGWHEALLLADGRVLVVGGFGDNPFSGGVGADPAAEIYDPEGN